MPAEISFKNLKNKFRGKAEKELEQAYQEISQDQERWKLTKQWEKTALKDLRKRLK